MSDSPSGKTAEQAEQGKHEKAIIRAFIVLAVIVIGGFLLAHWVINFSRANPSHKNEIREYNGFQFVKIGSAWYTQWVRGGDTYDLEFRHPPWDVENITVKGSVDGRFQRDYLFMTHDPTGESSRQTAFVAVASSDLTAMLTKVFKKKQVVPACTMNVTDACATRDIVTCSTNASVIYLKVSNQTGIFLDGNCATFQGVEENLTKAVDFGIYQWLGIIKK